MSDDVQTIEEAPLTQEEPAEELKILEDGTVRLGANNKQSLVRFMSMYQEMVLAGKPIPMGGLSKWIAERISDPVERQDCIMLVTGGRGTGKSRVSAGMCWNVALWLEKINKKPARTFFNGSHVVSLASGPEIAQRLADAPEMSCLVIDDAGVGLNARDFQTKANKGILRIISTVRTKKLFLIFNCPSRNHMDVALRSMVLLEAHIHAQGHSFEKTAPGFGYNLIKVNRVSQTPMGQEYRSALTGAAGKIKYWLVGNCPLEITKELEERRIKSADSLADGVNDLLSGAAVKKKRLTGKERWEAQYVEHGDKIRALLKENPKISVSSVASKTGLYFDLASRLMEMARGELNVSG